MSFCLLTEHFIAGRKTFVGLGFFLRVSFLLLWLLFFSLLPSFFKSVSLQDKWCLVGEMFSLLWRVLGCCWHLSSRVERWRFSFAHISLDSPLTLFTGHVAAPVVLAVASLHHFVHVGVVASATAHQVAAVAPVGGLVALPGRKKMRWASANPCRAFQTSVLQWAGELPSPRAGRT